MKTNKTSRPSSPPSAELRRTGVAALRRVDATKASAKSPATRPARNYVLRLFVAGATARSRQAVLRVRQLCAAELKDNCTLDVIDIYQQPHLARDNQIVATPTLIIVFPQPMRRFIGNLKNIADLFINLDLLENGRVVL